jgi:hypothetical protein
MTASGPLDGRNESVDFSEGALKERLETAVGGLTPDVTALTRGGVQRGEHLRRRRRAEAMSAAGLTAAAAAALAYSGVSFGWFDSNSAGPANTPNGTIEQINRPATARSLAAVALEHLPASEVIGEGTMGTSPQPAVFASVGLTTDQGKAQLDLLASSRVKRWHAIRACSSGSASLKVVQCHFTRLGDGTPIILAAAKTVGGSGPTQFIVSLGSRRDSQIVYVLEYSGARPQNNQQPVTDWRLPVGVATLRTIVTDPRFGVLTTPQMIARGNALANWHGSLVTSSVGSSSASAVTVSPNGTAPLRPAGPQATPPSAPAVGSAPAPARPSQTGLSSGP